MKTKKPGVRTLAIGFFFAICPLMQAIECRAYPIPELKAMCSSYRTDIIVGTVRDKIETYDGYNVAVIAVNEVFKGGIEPGSTITLSENDRFHGNARGEYVFFLWKPKGLELQVSEARELRLGKKDIYYQDLMAALGLAEERKKLPFISEETASELAKAYAIERTAKFHGSARNVRWRVDEAVLTDERWRLNVSYRIEIIGQDAAGTPRAGEAGLDSVIYMDAETGEILMEITS